MFETAGALASIQSVVALVGLCALPLLWAVWCWRQAVGFGAARAGVARRGQDLVGSIVGLTGAVGTLGLAVVLAARLAMTPRGTTLTQHVAQLGRLGQLDLAFDLALDRRSAVLVLVVALVACASAIDTIAAGQKGASARLAWTGLATAGAELVVLGDGFAPVLAGLGVLSIGAWGLASGGHGVANVTALAGNVAVLVGFVFLFWALGGAFGSEGYDPDGAPRFVLVTAGAGGDPTRATLSMTTHAGALVSSDDGDLPGEPIRSPFTVDLPPGIHTLRVQGGVASADVVVPRVALQGGSHHVLTPYGPTASLRALDDQVSVPRIAPGGRPSSVRATLAGRTIGGLRASAVVLLLVLAGALAHVHVFASRRGSAPLALVLEALPAPWLALRLAALVEPNAADGALVVLLGAGSAFVVAARAATLGDGHRALRGVLAAAASIAVASVGLGEAPAALVLVAATTVAAAAALAATSAPRDVRWLGVACAAAVGLLPGAGASSGHILALHAALAAAASGTPSWTLFAAVVAGAFLLSIGLSAVAGFRVYDALIRAQGRHEGSRWQGVVVIVLATVGLASGAVLGAGTTIFGGTEAPLARGLVAPSAPAIPKALALVATVLPLVAAAVGVGVAHRVGAHASPPWLVAFERPYAMFGWTANAVEGAARFLQRAVRTTERELVEDVPRAVREVVLRGGGGESRAGTRLRSSALLVMVALLGAIVLSSVVLR